MQPTIYLKLKIIEKFGSQFGFARYMGVKEQFVSRIVCGRQDLTENEQREWARVLSCKISDIFPVEKKFKKGMLV